MSVLPIPVRVRCAARAAALGGALLVGATASLAADEDKVDLSFSVPAKKVLRYRVSTQQEVVFSGMSITSNAEGEAELTALGPNEAGDALMALVFTKYESSVLRGDDLIEQDPGIAGKKVHVTVSRRGKILDFEPQTNLTDPQRHTLRVLADIFFMKYPDAPVSVNAGWKEAVDREGATGTVQHTLEKVEAKAGRRTARVRGAVALEMVSPPATAKGEVVATVSIEGGILVVAKGSLEFKGKQEGPSGVQSYECKLLE